MGAKRGRPHGSGLLPPERKIKNHTFGLSDRDVELLDWVAEFLATSKNDAMRSAIRSYAAQLATLEKKLGRPSGERP